MCWASMDFALQDGHRKPCCWGGRCRTGTHRTIPPGSSVWEMDREWAAGPMWKWVEMLPRSVRPIAGSQCLDLACLQGTNNLPGAASTGSGNNAYGYFIRNPL